MNLAAGSRACCALLFWLLAAGAWGQVVPLPPPLVAPSAAAPRSQAWASDAPPPGIAQSPLAEPVGPSVVAQDERADAEMVIMPDQYGEPIADSWTYQWLPGNLLYPTYLAGRKESRFQSVMAHDDNDGYVWDIALGGRVGLFRYGTSDCRPDGWQLDMEGAALPRLDLDHREDLMATDFRFGLPLSYGEGPWRAKFAFYHLSSHVGDEYMISHQSLSRVNYSRNALVWGNTYYLNDDTRAYVEVEWASDCDVGEPWAYQLGLDYSPSGLDGRLSAPFAALNIHLREEHEFGGNVVLQAGWQWRAHPFGRLLRVGAEYYDGKNDQFEFYERNEQKVGFGVWYDY